MAASNPSAPPVPHATQFLVEPAFKADQPLASGHHPPVLRPVQRVQGLKITPDGQDIHAFLAAGDRPAAKAIFEAIAAAVATAPHTHRERAIRMAAQSGLFAAVDDTVAP